MDVTYGFGKVLPGLTIDEANAKVADALKAEGFGIVTTLDVQATLKAKMGLDMRPYRIFGVCKPQIAHKALELEPMLGLLMPCNMTLQEVDGGIHVGFSEPMLMASISGNKALEPLMTEAGAKLRQVVAAL